jgi:hypothetical protein
MTDEIILSDEDVVSVENNPLIDAVKTSTIRELTEKLKSLIACNHHSLMDKGLKWTHNGVDCKILSVKGGGWQKGKIKVRFEFIPDPIPTKTTIPPKTISPLDDLRSQLNPE